MYSLKIDKKALDVEQEGGMILTANDPLNFQFGRASKTYSITLPNTLNNSEILDGIFSRNFGKTLVWDAVLEFQGIQMQGKLYIKRWNKQAASGQFVTLSGTLWAELAEKNLKTGFDWTDLDHELTLANVKATNLKDGDVMYDYIYRGDALLPNPLGVMTVLDIAEKQPAIRVKAILEKIFEGYTINQNLFTSAQYEALYLLYTQNQIRNSDGWIDDSKASGLRTNNFNIGITLQQSGVFRVFTFISDLFNEVENLEFSGIRYTVPEKGAYRFWGNVTADIEYFSGGFVGIWKGRTYTLTIDEYDGGTFIRTLENREITKDDAVPDSNGKIYDPDMDFALDSKIVELEAGRYIYFNISYSNFATDPGDDLVSPPPSQTMVFGVKPDSFLRVEPFNGIGFGGDVTGEWIIPDMTVAGFLSAIFQTFNVEFYSNVELKQVYLINRNNATPAEYNITETILNGSIQIDETPVKDNYLLKYTTDSKDDHANRLFNELSYSDGGKLIDNGSKDTTEIISPFSFNAVRVRPPYIIQMTKATKDEKPPKYSTDFNIRLAFYTGQVSGNHELHAGGTTNPTISNETEYQMFDNSITGLNLDYSTPTNGLYDKYYKGNIMRLTEGGVITCELLVDHAWLTHIYYCLGKDLRANYILQADGFQGKYQIIELDQIRENIFTAKLFRVRNDGAIKATEKA